MGLFKSLFSLGGYDAVITLFNAEKSLDLKNIYCYAFSQANKTIKTKANLLQVQTPIKQCKISTFRLVCPAFDKPQNFNKFGIQFDNGVLHTVNYKIQGGW